MMAERLIIDKTWQGWRLWLTRGIWLLLTGLTLLILLEMWPYQFWATYEEWVVSNTRPAVITFMAYPDFVRLVVILTSLASLVALALGLFTFWHRSNDKMGWLASLFLVLMSVWFLTSNTEKWRLPSWVPFAAGWKIVQIIASTGSLTLFLLLFPDGRFRPGWMRWLAVLASLGAGLFGLSVIFPLPITHPLNQWGWLIFSIPFVIAIGLGAAGQVYRYRQTADLTQRQQIKWVVFAISLYGMIFILSFFGLGGVSPWMALIELLIWLVVQLALPMAIGFSILRYRLWDIDILVNRTVVYLSLTLLVIGLYVLVVGVLSQWFQLIVRPLAAALATGFVAILFEPLRRRLQRGVNRLMYGQQDDPLLVLAQLGQQLEATLRPEAMLPAVTETIAQALFLRYLAITLPTGEIVAQTGVPTAANLSLPLLHQGKAIGQLLVSGELAPAGTTLLTQLARQIGTVVYALQLTTDLKASRQRLITAREEERRRLSRDLHDGLGPQLATIAMKLEATQNLLQQNPIQAGQLLDQLKSQTQTAIADIRRLVYGLRPPDLDQLGFASAIQEQVAGYYLKEGLTIALELPATLPPLPAAVEVAAYRIITEALHNVARHAQAHHCTVRLTLNGRLIVEIEDDGQGVPAGTPPGIGLTSIQERAVELGGSYRLESPTTGGTRLIAQLPL